MPSPLIALDWGTTRARAFLIAPDGGVLDRHTADRGIQSVADGGFPAAFAAIAGDFRTRHPEAKVVLAGMVGSRNGWIEAPYVACPAAPDAIAAGGITVDLGGGLGEALILPGLSCLDGAFDVMRGEETLIVGLGLRDGLACLPGTHSKWALVENGRITRFASFMTGEVFGLLRHQSILGRLATEPTEAERRSGAARGFAAAAFPGGLLNAAFTARSEVLGGRLTGGEVEPYLSALLLADEIAGARRLFGEAGTVELVADGVLADSYRAALEAGGIAARVTTPEAAFVAGVLRLAGSVR